MKMKKGPQMKSKAGHAMPTPAAGQKVKKGVEPGGLPFKPKGEKRKPGT